MTAGLGPRIPSSVFSFSLLALVALAGGCGQDTDATTTADTTSDGSDGNATSPTTDASTSDSDSDSDTTAAPEADGFGFACLKLRKGDGVAGDPFAGTQRIVVTLDYDPCLVDYYLGRPEMQQGQPLGDEVFTRWQSRLCSESVAGRVACEVEAMTQVFDATNAVYKLVVGYVMLTPETLDGGILLWGPAPMAEEAACEVGVPTVRLTSQYGLLGLGAMGDTLWRVQAFVSPTTEIALDASGCLDIAVEPEA